MFVEGINLRLLLLSRFCCYGLWPSSPVVQIVGDAVAFAAFRELGHNACRMFFTMAILALRHHLVLFLMTESAGQVFVLDLAGAQHAQNTAVARSAVF